MPAGAEIFNDTGKMVLSANLQNPVLKVSSSVTSVGSSLIVSYTRSSTSEVPICAIGPSVRTILLGNTDPALLTWEWHYTMDTSVNTAVPYYIFGTPPAPSGNFGLELYDAAGVLAFSVQNKPLRLRDVLVGTTGLAAGVGNDRVYDAGRVYAGAVGRWSSNSIYRTLPNKTEEFGFGFNRITNGLNTGALSLGTSSGNSATSDFADHELMVVDVTNY